MGGISAALPAVRSGPKRATRGEERAMSTPSCAAVILAAGKGTRMKSDLPKVLHQVAGLPMVGHVRRLAAALDPERVVVVVGPGMEAVAAAVAPAEICVQPAQRGTADAVMAARAALAGFAGDVVVLYGDTPLLRPETVAALIAARREQGAALAVLGFCPPDPAGYGRLLTASDGSLARIVEEADADAAERAVALCNSGVMAIAGARLFEWLAEIGNRNAQGEYYLTDLVAVARRQGGRAVVVTAEDADELRGVNSRADLACAEAAMQARLRARAMAEGASLIDPQTVYFSADTVLGRDVVIGPQVVFGPGVRIGDRVEIKPFCHIEGATVAPGAIVGPFARLRPGAEIGPDAHIGNFVEIKKARVEQGAKINHLAYVGDARVGAGANVGAGTITCNYDGFGKHFTDIGPGAFIGSNTCLVAPVAVGAGAYTGSGSVITEDVPAEALALTRAPQVTVAGWAPRHRARKSGQRAD